MTFFVDIAVWGGLLPAAISFAVAAGIGRLAPESLARRYATTLGVAAAFWVGYLLLPEWAELLPDRHWQWLPWLGIGAIVVGGIAQAEGLWRGERWLLFAALNLLSAVMLVPDWASLSPSRAVLVPALAVYLFALTVLLGPLLRNPSAASYPFLGMIVVAGSLSLAIAALISLRYGQVTGIVCAALTGCGLTKFFGDSTRPDTNVAPLFSVLVGGLAFIGAIEPEPPLFGLLALPAAALTGWLDRIPILTRARRSVRIAIQATAVLLLITASVAGTWASQQAEW